MQADSIQVQRPWGTPQYLILLYHGFGSTPSAMVPVGNRLSLAYPQSLVVSIVAPYPSDIGAGRQWFSLLGITDENRMQRVAASMDSFLDTVLEWQARAGLGSDRTVLAGFSQGATMLLEGLKARPDLAARAISFGGRFAALPTRPFRNTYVHLLHGQADPVVHCRHSIVAAERLLSMGSPVTLDIKPRVGYAIDEGMLSAALHHLLATTVRTAAFPRASARVPPWHPGPH
ncbi:MAG TPA: esterase [Noviherbaspirillum sp.]